MAKKEPRYGVIHISYCPIHNLIRLLGAVDDFWNTKIFFVDTFKFFVAFLFHPLKEGSPVFPANKYNRHGFHLFCLDKRQYFKQFIQRSESSRKKDIGGAMVRKHHLPDEEIVKVAGFAYKFILLLFIRQLDMKADGVPNTIRIPVRGRLLERFKSPSVCGFHNSVAASRNNVISRVCEQVSKFLRLVIPFISLFDASGSEKCDCVFKIFQELPPLDEFGHDPENPPVVRMPEICIRIILRRPSKQTVSVHDGVLVFKKHVATLYRTRRCFATNASQGFSFHQNLSLFEKNAMLVKHLKNNQ